MSNMLTDLRRRYAAVPEASRILQSDEEAQKYAMQEVQDALKDINDRLSVGDFGLRKLDDGIQALPQLNNDQENIKEQQREAVYIAIQSFNKGQKAVFNAVVGEILHGVTADQPFAPVSEKKGSTERKSSGTFLDAPGGTGKTFVMRTIQSFLKLRGQKVISTATSAVAASLLERGRTAHSAFKVPIPCDSDSVCSISMDSKLAAQIRKADLIIWDEIVMCARYCVEALERTLREIMNDSHILFGGKCILFSGDFRQILPVVPKASRGMIVHMCLKSSFIFPELQVLHLNVNMRLKSLKDNPNAEPAALKYPEYLLGVG